MYRQGILPKSQDGPKFYMLILFSLDGYFKVFFKYRMMH